MSSAKLWLFCPGLNILTRGGLGMSYGDIYIWVNIGLNWWLVAWLQQAITWINGDSLSKVFKVWDDFFEYCMYRVLLMIHQNFLR